jgi:hypothetical protein
MWATRTPANVRPPPLQPDSVALLLSPSYTKNRHRSAKKHETTVFFLAISREGFGISEKPLVQMLSFFGRCVKLSILLIMRHCPV